MSKEKIDLDKIITPVKELPPSRRLRRNPLYDGILDKAMSSSEKIFKIDLPVKRAYVPLANRIKKGKLQIKLKVRNKVLYLEKTSK